VEERIYDIGGKKFIQKPLVWGQVVQLFEILKGTEISTVSSPTDIILALGHRMPQALAIVLTEEGKSVRDKDIEDIASFFEFEVDVSTVAMVIEDFFVCNPTSLILERVQKMIGRLAEKVPEAPGEISKTS
jgi:hypothetical protein